MSFLSTFSSALTKARTSATPLTDQLQTRLGAQVQTPLETIDKLVERIQTSPNVEDRRTAVLGLKGCCREYKEVRYDPPSSIFSDRGESAIVSDIVTRLLLLER